MIRRITNYALVEDSWNLDYRLTDNPEAIPPLGPIGALITRKEWEEKRRAIDLFYSTVTDKEIAEFNAIVRKRYQREYDEAHKPAPRPLPKHKRPTPGHIYLMRSAAGHYKIGKSINPHNRQKAIGIKMPFEVELLYYIKVSDMTEPETRLHETLDGCRLNGEWFDLDEADVAWITSGDWIDDLDLRHLCESGGAA